MKIKGNFSDPFIPTSGVPQCSHLGPLIFILFINDVANNLTVVLILIYLDDIEIFTRKLIFMIKGSSRLR